ncbi:MAG: ABC transporter permease [Acidimicrobiales bacterium]
MADRRDAGRPGELRVQLGIYRHLLAARIRSDWQYRTSFLLLLATQTLVAGLDLAVIAVLFGKVDALAGWSALEVGLLYGLGGVAFAFGDLFVSQVEYAGRHIKAGTFDRFLLRPMSPLLQLSAGEFALRRSGRLVQPCVVLAIALAGAGIHWTPDRAVLVPVALASGTAVFGAIWVLTSSVAFWTVETQEFGNAFTYGGNHLTQYPIDVLGPWLRRLVTFVVPLAFVAYFPAAYLLDKPDPLGAPPEMGLASPVVALVMVLVARATWLTAVRHYRSTGS